MKKFLCLFILGILSLSAYSQDLIVKKDGSVIQAKVAEIGTSEVKYKKWSNQDGPTYSIAIADILAINYQNGEKETYDDAVSLSMKEDPFANPTVSPYIAAPENIDSLQSINSAVLEFTDQKLLAKYKKEEAEDYAIQYGITENSVLESDELSIRFTIGILNETEEPVFWESFSDTYGHAFYLVAVKTTLENKSNETLFVDLANTFLSIKKKATSFYVPTATTTMTSTTTGGAFNLGGITNALGVGGVVGALANAATVSRSGSTTKSSVVYSQRVISIPPHSMVTLPAKHIIDDDFFYAYKVKGIYARRTGVNIGKNTKLNVGEELEFNETDAPYQFSFYTTVSHNEDFSVSKTAEATLYCKKILGAIPGGKGKQVKLSGMCVSTNGLYSFGHKNR